MYTTETHTTAYLQAALELALLPDDETLKQLTTDSNFPFYGSDVEELRWPEEPLRSLLIRKFPF